MKKAMIKEISPTEVEVHIPKDHVLNYLGIKDEVDTFFIASNSGRRTVFRVDLHADNMRRVVCNELESVGNVLFVDTATEKLVDIIRREYNDLYSRVKREREA